MALEDKKELEEYETLDVSNTMKLMDRGAAIARIDPEKALAVAEVLIEKGLIENDSPEGKYINDISDALKTHGNKIHTKTSFSEHKRHFTAMIKSPDILQEIKFNISKERNLRTLTEDTNSLKDEIQAHHNNLLTAAENTGDTIAAEKLNGVWNDNDFLFLDDGDSVFTADEVADNTQKIMNGFQTVLNEHPDLKSHYESHSTEDSKPSATQYSKDIGSIHSRFQKLEAHAIILNQHRAEFDLTPHQKVETGTPKVELGLNN